MHLQVHRLAFHNRDAVARSEKCGCYFCGHIFPPSEIKTYTDAGATAMCPRCAVDAVLGTDQGVPVTEDFMKAANKYCFPGGKNDPAGR